MVRTEAPTCACDNRQGAGRATTGGVQAMQRQESPSRHNTCHQPLPLMSMLKAGASCARALS